MRKYAFVLLLTVVVIAELVLPTSTHFGGSTMAVAWLGPALGLASTAASGIIGAIMATKQQKKIDEAIAERQNKLDAWRDAQMSTNYLDRADSREMLRRVAQYNDEQMRAMNTNAVKGGSTEEAKVAAANQLNRTYADAIGSIASAGQRHRDSVESQYRAGLDNIDNLKLNQLMGDNTAGIIASTIGQMGNVLASTDFSKMGKNKQ